MVVDLTRKVIGVHDNHLRPELLHHEIGAKGTMLIVADGLGGHEGGEIASQLAVDTVAQTLLDAVEQGGSIAEHLAHAVDVAHEAICKYHGAKGRTRHMASTLTAVHVGPGGLTIAQVGDSRAYRLSQGKLTLLTEDQTVVHMMQKKGMLSPEEAQNHPHRNIILQALGQDKSVLPELQTLPLQHGDCLLLCSDGLSSYVDHAQMEAIMASGEDEHIRCRRLIEAANGAGGADNVTVLLARLIIKDGGGVAEPAHTGEPASQGSEPSHKSIWTTPLPLPQTHPVRAHTDARPEEKESRHTRTLVMRSPWSTKGTQPAKDPVRDLPKPPQPAAEVAKPGKDGGTSASPAAAPSSEAQKTSIWRREIKWPWSSKAAPTTAPTAAERHEATQAGAALGEAEVLKALEEQLARYIGPVAKVLVARAAQRAKDFPALCQALAAHLSTEQEREHFLRTVARYNPARPRRS
ncbi:MAG: PP2C family serine/threonine-protein phosphatase [Candidatus Tectimicrobiota bacterium]